MTARWSPEVADLVARAIREGIATTGAWEEQPPDVKAMYQRGAARVLGALFGAGADYRVELVAEDGWTEAKPGQTPGGLVPGEGDVPHPLHLGALRAAVRLTTVRDMECVILRRDVAADLLVYVDELRAANHGLRAAIQRTLDRNAHLGSLCMADAHELREVLAAQRRGGLS